MDALTIGEIVLAAVIGIVGYFVKVVHSDVRTNTKDIGENKGKMNTLESRIEHESELRSQSYRTIMDTLTEIKADLKELKTK